MNDEYGGVAVDETPSATDEFGGVSVVDSPKRTDEFGGVAIDESSPAPSALDSSPTDSSIKIDPLKNFGVYNPSQYSSGLSAFGTPADNPDWAFTQAMSEGGSPLAFAKNLALGVPRVALAAAGAVAKKPYLAAADVVSKVTGNKEFGGNIAAELDSSKPPDTLPVEKFLGDVSQTNPALATVGKISAGIAEMAPMFATAGLSAGAQKLLGRYFVADMLYHAPQTSKSLYDELQKPVDQRNPDKITSLISEGTQQLGFGLWGASHEISNTRQAMIDKYAPRGQGIGAPAIKPSSEPLPPVPNKSITPASTEPAVPTVEAASPKPIEATASYIGYEYEKRNGQWFQKGSNEPLLSGDASFSAEKSQRDSARFISELERRAIAETDSSSKTIDETVAPLLHPDTMPEATAEVTGSDLKTPEGARPSVWADPNYVPPVMDAATVAPPGVGGLPLDPKMQEQLDAANIHVSPGMTETILTKKIKSPLAFQRVFPKLALTLEQAQEVLNGVWKTNENVPEKYLNQPAKIEAPQAPAAVVPVAPKGATYDGVEPIGNRWQFTIKTDPKDPASGATFYVEKGSTPEQIQAEADKTVGTFPKTETPTEPAPPLEQPTPAAEPVAELASEEPFLSRIANRFSQERSASGEIGEIAPGQGYSTQDLVNRGLKMKPEEVSQHISDLMNKRGGDPVLQGAAVRAEEVRLSQKSQELSRIADNNPTDVGARKAADEAFKEITKFHEGPIANLKTIFHGVGEGLQGEIPVDLSTFNGLREQWLRDNRKAPPARMETEMRKTARNIRKAVSEERSVIEKLGNEINRITRGKKLPSPESVRDAIIGRMKHMPCR